MMRAVLAAPYFELEDVTYRAGPRLILDRLSLRVYEGETYVLLGRSGSGKTTLLRLLNGLLQPSSGRVQVAGRAVAEWDPIALRHRTGYMLQEGGLFPHFTVERNVGLVPRLLGWPAAEIAARVRHLLALLDLPEDLLPRFPRQLSGGQRQRTGVARALAADPPALLMDEPFGALDPITRREVQLQFQGLARNLGKTAVLVTHDAREALLLATRIGLLESGRLVVEGTAAEFLASPHPEARAFLESAQGAPRGA